MRATPWVSLQSMEAELESVGFVEVLKDFVFETALMDLETIMLGEISQLEKDNYAK